MSTRAHEGHQSHGSGGRIARDSRRDDVPRGGDASARRGVRQDRSQPVPMSRSTRQMRKGARQTSRRTSRDEAPRRDHRDSSRSSREKDVRSRNRSVKSVPSRVLDFVSRHRRPLVAVGVALVVFLSLYGPVQRYYVAWRTQGDEQAKVDYLNGDNDALKQDIDRLTTRSGVENEARARGYRYPSEDTNSEGSDDENAGSASSSSSNGNAGASEGANAPSTANQGSNALDDGFSYEDIQHPWYIHVFDVIFAYSSPQN